MRRVLATLPCPDSRRNAEAAWARYTVLRTRVTVARRRLRSFRRLATVCLVVAWLLGGVSSVPSFSRGDTDLPDLLRKVGRVAALYRDEALHFACDETITLYGPSDVRSMRRKYSYIFVYDDEGRLRDHRLRRRAKKEESAQSIDLTESGLPSWVLRAYSSILLFEKPIQERYRYEIVGRETALGRPAIRVALEPRHKTDTIDRWHGTAWIDAENYQLLRFEGLEGNDHARRARFEGLVEQWDRHGRTGVPPFPVEIHSVSTEFGVQRNGMRFPSRVIITATRLSSSRRAHEGRRENRVFTIKQEYERYRFYRVRTTEQISRAVWAEE